MTRKATAKKGGAKKAPAKSTTKKSASKKAAVKKPATKKSPAKKSASRKPAKKAAPKKASVQPKALASANFKVVCSKEGVLARRLTMQQAQSLANDHQAQTGHPTTFVGSQRG